MDINDIIEFVPAFCNRAGTFQIAQANSKLNGKYLFTLWTFFPKVFDLEKEASNHYRFIANAVKGESNAKELFKSIPNVIIEELPYTEGYYFPIITNDDEAVKFIGGGLFGNTYKEKEGE